MFTSLWSTGAFRKDLAKGVYSLPWACPSLHMNIHLCYYTRALVGTWGRDCTAVRRRIVLYSFQPFFPHNVTEMWQHYQALVPEAERCTYRAALGMTKVWRQEQIARLHRLHASMYAIKEDRRMVTCRPSAAKRTRPW